MLFHDNFSLCLVPINRCNFRCKDCCQDSTGEGLEFSFEDISTIIREAEIAGCDHICVSGGGETSLFRPLLKTIKLINSFGLGSSLVTNAWWGRWPDSEIVEFLRSLAKCGLRCLNLSTDKYHQEFLPVKFIKRIIDLRDCYCPNLDIDINWSGPITKEQKDALFGYRRYLKTQAVHRLKRAASLPDSEFDLRPVSEILKIGSDCGLRFFMVKPHENGALVSLNCCTPFLKPVEIGKDFFKRAFATLEADEILRYASEKGISGIVEFADYYDIVPELEKYSCACELCAELMNKVDIKRGVSHAEKKKVLSPA